MGSRKTFYYGSGLKIGQLKKFKKNELIIEYKKLAIRLNEKSSEIIKLQDQLNSAISARDFYKRHFNKLKKRNN